MTSYPSLTTDTQIEEQVFSNQSYSVTQYRVQGFVRDLEALRQAIHKRLTTQQFEYPIYTFFYGVNWRDLIGREPEYVRPEMIRMIRETLAQDDRISSVSGFDFVFEGNVCKCSFDVQSIFGHVREGVEVEI